MNKDLFGNGREKILRCFYTHRNNQMYFREILREAKLTPNTTLKHLKVFKDLNLIKSTKTIANTYYRINPKNPLVYSIFSYFDYERLESLETQRKRAIKDYINGLLRKPLIALIFGSTAKGTASQDSDIDLLLVFNSREKEDEKLIKDIEAVTGHTLTTFIITYNEFKTQVRMHEDKVITHAIKTGFCVSGFDIFYTEVLND